MDIGRKLGYPFWYPRKKDFKPKLIKKDREGYYIILKGKIQKNIIILTSIYKTQGYQKSQ